MKIYGYALVGAFVVISVIGNVGKARIEKQIEADKQKPIIELSSSSEQSSKSNSESSSTDPVSSGNDTSSTENEVITEVPQSVSSSSSIEKSSKQVEDNDKSSSKRMYGQQESDSVLSDPTGEEEHVHEWIPVTNTVHHDAVTENVWVVDSAAWDEPVYETRNVVICNGCEGIFTKYDDWVAHCHNHTENNDLTHGSYRIEPHETQINTIHHDEVGHYETKIVSPAWDEEVSAGYRCDCGATR